MYRAVRPFLAGPILGALILIGLSASAGSVRIASAQTRTAARLTQALSGNFPQMSLFVAVDDASGGRARGLTPDQFQVIEDNQPRTPQLGSRGAGADASGLRGQYCLRARRS